MKIEEQLRDYRATLETATDDATGTSQRRIAPPIRMRPARTLVVAAVAVAAAIAVAFAAVGVSRNRSTPPASVGPTTPATEPTFTMPNVVGMKPLTALSTLGPLALDITTVDNGTPCAGRNIVIARQVPAPGTRIQRKSSATIVQCALPPTRQALPVVVCDTTYGVPPDASSPKAPKSITIKNPPFDSPKLSGYSDLRGYLPITAPAGWNCKAIEAGDGGQGVGVTPPGVAPRDNYITGYPNTLPLADGVFAMYDPACQGCVYGEICGIVPSADADFPDFAANGGCPVEHPAGEHVTPLGDNRYAIDDPAGTIGPDAAHSVLRYTPRTASTDAQAMRITCILPASQRNVCSAIIDQFFALHPSN
jgi:hypothetical protein